MSSDSKRPKKRKGGKRKSSSRRRGYSWGLRILALLFLAGLGLAAYLHHLDGIVQVKFAGKRWAVPAHVYARPLELFPGASFTREQVANELKQLGYQAVAGAPRPGTFGWHKKIGLAVYSRGFAFWDGKETAKRVEIEFSKSAVTAMRSADGKEEVALLRLDPLQIASIYPAHKEDRVLVRYQDIPETLVKGLVAAEDRDFFDHGGVSLKGISRAMWANIRAGRMVQGGSTLTQQLVKNFYLTRERSLKRKINEAFMALLLEKHYGKEDILQAYANEIFLGQDGQRAIHGFGMASRFYFNRPLEELDINGQALLITLIRGASYYNPVRHPKRALKRRNLILDVMAEQGVITADVAAKTKTKPLGLSINKTGGGGSRFPAFMDLVRRQLSRDYKPEDLNSEGLKIFTTMDPWVQRQGETALAARLAEFEKRRKKNKGKLEGAIVVVGRDDGEVQAVVGGKNSSYAGFNRALDAVRPIGSLVKPAVYLTALALPELYNLVTPLRDETLTLENDGKAWKPKNYDGKEHGIVPLYEALARSYNLATVNLGLDLGVNPVINTLKALGVHRPIKAYPSLFLGSLSLAPIEVIQMYQTLAAGGYRTPLRTIREVLDQNGKPLQRYPLDVRKKVDAASVHLLNTALQTVVQSGTAASLTRWVPRDIGVAGKTGTTDGTRDSWFAGFTGDRVAVVWVGRDDNKPSGLTGSSGALQVWGNMMSKVSSVPLELVAPESVVYEEVDVATGLKPGEECVPGELMQAPFIRGYEPLPGESCKPKSRGFFWENF